MKDPEAFAHFTGILVDGEPVDPENYKAESGSVIISLQPEYLETLEDGEHILTAGFDDGNSPTAAFSIVTDEKETEEKKEDEKPSEDDNGKDDEQRADQKETDSSSDEGTGGSDKKSSSGNGGKASGSGSSTHSTGTSPRTGDDSDLTLWLLLAILSAAGLAATGALSQRIKRRM